MGTLSFFDEIIEINDDQGKESEVQVIIQDNHSKPEIKIKDKDGNYTVISFEHWQQFARFSDSITSLHQRLSTLNRD